MEQRLERASARQMGQTRALVMTGLFAALGCVATLVLQIPSPTGGYLNLGDTVVILGAYLLGPALGAAAGGVGPALADLLSEMCIRDSCSLLPLCFVALVWLLLSVRCDTLVKIHI